MKRVAVVLSGCGHLDGSEIREAVLSLLALDRAGATVSIFAPDRNQHHVINHITGEEMPEKRNVLVESARIARGQIQDLKEAKADDFDALVLPGGYGAAKNLSDLAFRAKQANVIPEFKRLILEFIKAKKPIGAICISPAVLVAAVREHFKAKVTIGDDDGGLIGALGGEHVICATDAITVDEAHKLVSCSAYMRNDSLAKIAEGIDKLVAKVLALA